MYMLEGDPEATPQRQPLALTTALLITGIGTLLLGILPYMSELAEDVTLAVVGG
jgi:hypothetical protein